MCKNMIILKMTMETFFAIGIDTTMFDNTLIRFYETHQKRNHKRARVNGVSNLKYFSFTSALLVWIIALIPPSSNHFVIATESNLQN